MVHEDAGAGHRLTPARIAAIYVLVGGAWILVSDWAVAALPVDPGLASQIQTVKGWVFVGASALLIYVLVARGRRQFRLANEDLTRALQQASVLHRLLRHNLRNACTVIQLEAEKLANAGGDRGSSDDEARGHTSVGAIERQVQTLLELAEKSRHLRRIALGEQERIALDLAEVVEAEIDRFEATDPAATVTVDVPDSAWVLAYPEVEIVVRELLENTVEHYPEGDGEPEQVSGDATDGGRDEHDRSESRSDGAVAVDVAVERREETVSLTVADDGPGLPPMEREVLERGIEEPLSHSQGLGLWIVRAIATDSGGELSVRDNDPTGTVVRVDLERAGPGHRESSHRQTV